MKVVIINKSDSVGGAAVVSRRLLDALRARGVDATMLVADRHCDSSSIRLAAGPAAIRRSFLAERLRIFLANGMNRATLFKIDTASDGLPLHRRPEVKEADVICLNWVNQGLLSLKGLRALLRLGKPVVWTMHDMWNFTGICHHAGDCGRWRESCGDCPFLGANARPGDLSFKIWDKKMKVYPTGRGIHFVAVSNWLADLARKSSLLKDSALSVIPNAFPVPPDVAEMRKERTGGPFRIVMGAARLDDTVKGLPILVEATKQLRRDHPSEAAEIELVTFGTLKNPDALAEVAVPHRHLGMVSGEENIRDIYLSADAVVSTSLYETLPGTLVEGQVYGCVPVSFGRGGQRDIVEHLQTGYIAEWSDDPREAATRIVEGLLWAKRAMSDPDNARQLREKMLTSARLKFSADAVATRYLHLFHTLLH